MAFSVGVMSAMYLTKGITGNRWTQTSSCDLSTHCLHRHTYSKMHNVRIHFAASHSELWLFHYCITEYSRFITLMSGALCKEALSSLSRSSLTDIQLTIITLSWHTIWRQIIWDFITFQSLSLSVTVIHFYWLPSCLPLPPPPVFLCKVPIWTRRWVWVSACWDRCDGEGWCPTASPSCWGRTWRQRSSTWSTMVSHSCLSDNSSVTGRWLMAQRKDLTTLVFHLLTRWPDQHWYSTMLLYG